MKHILSIRGGDYSLCGKQVLFCDTAAHYDADCEECKRGYKLKNIFKMSEYMKEVLPDIDFETIKKVFSEIRKFEYNVNGKYCNVCMKQLNSSELSNISPHDFLACCFEHIKYRQYFQVDLIRNELGIKVEDLPIYE